ncbi:MAG: hypothetical protein NTX00_00915 [Candidatus Parcubacteria bacterium]|nr:hypothetical protein [Candidatus Parcubacteria bacterium]
MKNLAEQHLEPPQDKKIEEEKTREIIALIYENIENLRKGEGFNHDLEKKLPAGKDILMILKTLGQTDIIPFLLKFKEKTQKVSLDQIPEEHLLISLLKEGKGFDPHLIELGLILDSLKMKFKRDVIADILRRDYLEKQLSELEPILPTIETDLLLFGKAYDDLKILMFQRGIKLADFKNLSPRDQLEFKKAEVKFVDIAQAMDREVLKIAKREDEYKDLEKEKHQKFWSRFEKLDNGIAQAQKDKLKPVDFFQKKDLHFLAEIFANRFDSLAAKKDKINELSKEYFQKYII